MDCILSVQYFSLSELTSLINGHCHLPPPAKKDEVFQSKCSQLPAQLSLLIDLAKLQESVVEFCIAGMPLLDNSSISSLRIPFIFKEDKSRTSLQIRYDSCAMYAYEQLS